MAGPTGAGFTHFNKLSGKNGLYVGVAGSEIKVADTSSSSYRGSAGSEYSVADKDEVITWIAGSVSAGTVYVVAPYSASVAGYVVQGGAAPAVPGTVTATVGSAGAILLTATPASAGIAGAVTAMSNTSGTTTIASGGSIKLDLGTSGTAYSQTVAIVLTRAGA